MAAYSLEDTNLAPEAGNGIYGDFAVCPGPQTFCSGGVWLIASPSTDNLTLDKEIMENLTCNSNFLYQLAQNEEIFTNSVSAMKKVVGDGVTDSFLGGQNANAVYYEAASRLNTLPANNYDRWIGDAFRNAMIYYYAGEKTGDEAWDYFYERVRKRFPELKTD